MKRLFAALILAASAFALSAPAHATDAGTLLAIQMGGGMVNSMMRINHRRPCYRPNVVINGRCMPPRFARPHYVAPRYIAPTYVAGGTTEQYREEYGAYSNQAGISGQGRGKPTCKQGSKYIAEVGGCVRSVRDVAELQRIAPDLAVDPECRGKPPGFKFDREVTGARGEVGFDHRVCGSQR